MILKKNHEKTSIGSINIKEYVGGKAVVIRFCVGCIPVHLDFIVPVHLEHHTSGSSRPSYLWYI